jgi:hypothetical protein
MGGPSFPGHFTVFNNNIRGRDTRHTIDDFAYACLFMYGFLPSLLHLLPQKVIMAWPRWVSHFSCVFSTLGSRNGTGWMSDDLETLDRKHLGCYCNGRFWRSDDV